MRKSEEKCMKIENLCINCMKERQDPDGVCEHCGFDERKYDLPQHHMKPFTILAGKYLIGKAIGEGGFGITYIGMDLELEVRVAIKEYYPQGVAARVSGINDSTVCSCTDSTRPFFEEGREKFINEARTIAKFRGLPEIVGVIEFFRENQTAYIVMEYLDGQTLKQYLKANGGKIPTDEILRMMRPLISSLGKIHSEGLIHRDISPDNIMLMKDKSIKILDFGGARDFASQNGKSMSVLVKHGYAPEEQYRSQGDQGPWTDVYALCATMYRCITGKIPPEALERLNKDELKPISSFGVDCPKHIEKAILKGLAVRKDGRYQSMEELYDALYKKQKEPEKPTKPDKKTKLIIAAAAIAAGIIAVAYGMTGKENPERIFVEAETTPTPTAVPTVTPTPTITPTPVPRQLNIEGGKGSGTYKAGEKIKVFTDIVNPYFPVWVFEKKELGLIEDIYARETTLIMPDSDSDIICYQKSSTEAPADKLLDQSGDFVIKIDGEDYALPISVQKLEDKGWKCDFGDFTNEDIEKYSGYYLTGGSARSRGSFDMTVKIHSKEQIDIMSMEFWGDSLQVELPGGIIHGKSTRKEVQDVYGKSDMEAAGALTLSYYIPGNVTIVFCFESDKDAASDEDVVSGIIVRKIPEDYIPPQN